MTQSRLVLLLVLLGLQCGIALTQVVQLGALVRQLPFQRRDLGQAALANPQSVLQAQQHQQQHGDHQLQLPAHRLRAVRLMPGRKTLKAGEGTLARIARLGTELILDAHQLVVLGHAVRTR